MADKDYLQATFPRLSAQLPRMVLATLPTPVEARVVDHENGRCRLAIKYDNLSGPIYGGNKLRKLEYLFPKAKSRQCRRIATFGAAGSNHALATALYAREAGFDCTCFLSHQAKSPLVAATLNKHLEIGTELVRYGGALSKRLMILRDHLWNRDAWVIPMGGSSWLGTIGFVAAGLELADQIATGVVDAPNRIYVGSGTMGTAVGIALGLAAAGASTEVHAVRVSDVSITNEVALRRLLGKTAEMMRHYDASVPNDLAALACIRLRNEFFGPGYAQGTEGTAEAIRFARQKLGLELEQTYTGKAMEALLADLREPNARNRSVMFWHTYNSVPLNVPADEPLDRAALPPEFTRYFE
jgi:D-cysteine desulfhydrase